MNSKDLRVVKTRKNIETSFIRLLDAKNFHDITVQNILDEALINRTTFYKHYSDKYELAQNLCDIVFNDFTDAIEKRFTVFNKADIINSIENLYNTLSNQQITVLNLFKIHTETLHLYDDMTNFLKNRFYNQYHSYEKYTPEVLDYLSNLYASIVMISIKWCLENNSYDIINSYLPNFLKVTDAFL